MEWRLILAVPLLIGLWFMYKLMKAKLDISMARIIQGEERGSAEATVRRTKATPEGHVLENIEASCSGKTLKECLEGVDVLLLMNKNN